MANKKAAKKAMRQAVRRRELNRSVRSSVATLAKKAVASLVGGNASEAEIAIRSYESLASRAARRNIVAPGMVSRRVSRLVAKFKALGVASSS